MNRRTRILAATLALGLTSAATACTVGEKASGGDSDDLHIGLIQEARPDVEPWSLAWHDSLEAVKAEDSGIRSTETFEAYDATRAEPVIRQLLDGGADVMAMSTFVLTDIAKAVAKEYPEVPMVLTSFDAMQQPNLSAATSSYLEIGYSTCWLLTKLSKDGRVGVVGAQKAPFEVESHQGCELGAKAANPKAKVTLVNSNSFTDAQANREQVQNLLDQGIDNIFLVSGTEDAVGGFRLCEQVGAHCATWGGDARKWAPTAAVLTVELDWTMVFEDLIEQARSGKLEAKTWNLTYGNSGLRATGVADSAAVDDDLRAEFDEMVAGLADESIQLPESISHPGLR
ncbi:BMP family lipoprotein [Nocardioides daejeonensis]|uniref:BMP family lipoprotein n=1 Tax=Nocardioides daejeonensis TaxID=1046556 RepID=UPI0013A59410|nr:BMP family ABC transporter substrate-binding protein [Nocardioides daejeonensis]